MSQKSSAPAKATTLTVFQQALILSNNQSDNGKVFLSLDALVGGRSQRFELQGLAENIDSESLPMRSAVDLVAEMRPFCWVDKKSGKARMSNEVLSLTIKS